MYVGLQTKIFSIQWCKVMGKSLRTTLFLFILFQDKDLGSSNNYYSSAGSIRTSCIWKDFENSSSCSRKHFIFSPVKIRTVRMFDLGSYLFSHDYIVGSIQLNILFGSMVLIRYYIFFSGSFHAIWFDELDDRDSVCSAFWRWENEREYGRRVFSELWYMSQYMGFFRKNLWM
jgi:hypothetical protein